MYFTSNIGCENCVYNINIDVYFMFAYLFIVNFNGDKSNKLIY